MSSPLFIRRWLTVLSVVVGLASAQSVQPQASTDGAVTLPAKWADALKWRSIGPATMSGRITAISVSQQDPNRWWAATASGGLLFTSNSGGEFQHQFDKEATVSIGDVAVAPSNHDIVWVGTGEANPRNSVSWGDGVYKSLDGGKTWKNMGLKNSFQIGRIAIHPTNPDIVYIGALGRLWGDGGERGLYRTTNGGNTWECVFECEGATGVIDIKLSPANPDLVLMATWDRRRGGYDSNDPVVKWGKGSGLWRSRYAGAKGMWEKVTNGLPTGLIGRIGLDWYVKDAKVVYMVLDSEKIGMIPENAGFLGITAIDEEKKVKIQRVTYKGPAAQAGLKADDIVLTVNGEEVKKASDLVAIGRSIEVGKVATVTYQRGEEKLAAEVTMGSDPVHKPATRPSRAELPGNERSDVMRPLGADLGGQQANVMRHQSFDGHEYGGLYRSEDEGLSWTRINTLNPRPMYFSCYRVDPNDDQHQWVLGVSQARSKDRGATFTSDGGRGVHADGHAVWIDPRDGKHIVIGCDGGLYQSFNRGESWDHLNTVALGQFYHVDIDATRNYKVYGGLQDNGSWGAPHRTGTGGPVNEDWFRVGGGDGFFCRVDPDDPNQIYFESQNGGMGRIHLGTGERGSIRPEGGPYRFNWNTPFVLSKHNPKIYYVGGNHLFRSLDRGKALKRISPKLTLTEVGSATYVAESPEDPDVLYVGTDDGALWRTRDGGVTWDDIRMGGASTRPTPNGGVQVGDAGAGWPPMLADLDADGDGKISREEAGDGPASRMFDRADENEDGFITLAEARTAMESFGAGGGGPGGQGRGGARRGGREAGLAPLPPPGRPLSELVRGPRCVSGIVVSKWKKDRIYLTLDGHRSDEDGPLAFVSEDAGDTWTPIHTSLPAGAGSTRTIAEDRDEADLLYLGTEFGAWVSFDRGWHWQPMNGNLPTVAVHAFAQSPVCGDIVVATHGRSLWIIDATPLRQLAGDARNRKAAMLKPGNAVIWRSLPSRGGTNFKFTGQNPVDGARLAFIVPEGAKAVSLEVRDVNDRVIARPEVKAEPGYQEVMWGLRSSPAPRAGAASRPDSGPASRPGRGGGAGRGQGGAGGGGAPGGAAGVGGQAGPGGRGGRGGGGARVAPGNYRVVLTVDGKTYGQELIVELDPDHPKGAWSEGGAPFGDNEVDDDGREHEGEPTEPMESEGNDRG